MNLDDSLLDHLLQAIDAPDLSGTPYRILNEIGRGGMGVVYRVHDSRLDREIAMKVFDGTATEARITAALEHPGIVPVHDSGMLPDGRGYYTMRLVRGLPLQQHIGAGTPLSVRIAIFQKICEAVAYAHSRGVIHRDLKPSNVMAGEFGEVAVLDWGIAVDASSGAAKIAGTPKFMAPEQARGEAATPLADVYSMGALLDSILPGGAPAPLRAIAAKASAANPDRRYRNASEIGADLSRYIDGFAVEAYRENPVERTLRFMRRNKTLLLLVGAYFAVRIGIYFFSGR